MGGVDWPRVPTPEELAKYTDVSVVDSCYKTTKQYVYTKGYIDKKIIFSVEKAKCGDSWKKILIVANPEESEVSVALDGDGDWRLISDGVKFYKKEEVQIIGNGSTVSVKPKTVTIYALS